MFLLFVFFNRFQNFSTSIFPQLLKNINFRSVVLVTKRFGPILDFFFHRPDFLPPYTLPYELKKIDKNPLNYYALKVTKFHGYSEKMRVLGQNNYRAGPACLWLKAKLVNGRSPGEA